jgi:hypothetical protein
MKGKGGRHKVEGTKNKEQDNAHRKGHINPKSTSQY